MGVLPGSRRILQYAGLISALLGLVLVFGGLSENFLQARTAIAIANQIPDLTLIAVGMTFVLIIGGIDLSVGSILALSSAVLGVLMVDYGWSVWMALPVCLLVGVLCGLSSGLIAIGTGIPSFIVTLGMLEIARGAAKVITQSQTKYIGSAVELIGEPLGGLQLSPAFLLAVAVVLMGEFLLVRTVFGRYLVAIGSNRQASKMSGIRVKLCSVIVFGISGLLCGMAGVTQTARLSSADPNAAVGIELSAIAACVIGGTSLTGGRGSIINTFLGVLMIAVLQTGLAQIGASDPTKQIVTGTVIIAAVLLDALRGHWKVN